MALSFRHWSEARETIRRLLCGDDEEDNGRIPEGALISMSETSMHLPARIGDYTDFYSSLDHATNVGTMFR